ncbi:hypothetical protein WJX72_007564 [[Myrmecia] bisecta]|uniref:ATPase AAA-type core domain-containing protein n=1 Tax=[Myrmecia] bisecta TaxID=41462 RepID=A0AAW1R7W4_9CHLO
MAREIGRLTQDIPLSQANFIKISCASLSTATELFGLSGAYRSSHIDSELNGFVRQHDGKYGVVLLDEFEKLEQEAQLGFLEAFDTGRWIDKRTDSSAKQQTTITDCSKLIFILTTNVQLDRAATPQQQKLSLPFAREVIGRFTELELAHAIIEQRLEAVCGKREAEVALQVHIAANPATGRLYATPAA